MRHRLPIAPALTCLFVAGLIALPADLVPRAHAHEADGEDHVHAHDEHDAAIDHTGHHHHGLLHTHDLSLDGADDALAAALAKARAIDTAMNIAVVDAGGNLKAFARMDGAWLGSIDIAIKKARTARLFDMPTGEIGKLSRQDGPLFNIEHSNDGLITFPGGLPITDEHGHVIGAIGVSGSTVENDHAVAAAGAETLLAPSAPTDADPTEVDPTGAHHGDAPDATHVTDGHGDRGAHH
jgi:uncharacterized protein GlcG (DUF336 family)